MSLATQATADFLAIAADHGSEALTHTRTGPGTTTAVPIALCFKTDIKFGETAVPGYGVDAVVTRFPASVLSTAPKEGDTITRSGVVYEVVAVSKMVRDTQWRLECARAYINGDYDVSIVLNRFTLSTDVAGSVTEQSYAIGTYSAIVMLEDDVADMINRLGIKGDKQSLTFFVDQTVPALPMDMITYSGRDYRITMIGDEGRIARLKKIRVELYA